VARRPNYGFEKRQKELKREQKRDEKAERKRQRQEQELADGVAADPALAEDETPGDGDE
jgi:hypothetical protein